MNITQIEIMSKLTELEIRNYFTTLDNITNRLEDITEIWSELFNNKTVYSVSNFELDEEKDDLFIYISSHNTDSCGYYDETSYRIKIDFLMKSNEEIRQIWEDKIKKEERKRQQIQENTRNSIKFESEEKERRLYEKLKLKFEI